MTPPENSFSPDDRELAQAVAECSRDDSFLNAIRDAYRDIDCASDPNSAICLGGGACCRFDLFDHRLYATLGELAILSRTEPSDASRMDLNRCPHQQGPRCLARENRPLGCRVFFCRESPRAEENRAYETAHSRIRRLHAEYDLPYAYVELISALKILRQFAVDTL